MQFTLEQPTLSRTGQVQAMDAAPSLGARVGYDPATRTITLELAE